MIKSDSDYRISLDCPMEDLGFSLVKIGVIDKDDTSHDDAALIEIAARKMEMLYEMIIASGVPEGIVKAALKG